jgi:hypothetical protein
VCDQGDHELQKAVEHLVRAHGYAMVLDAIEKQMIGDAAELKAAGHPWSARVVLGATEPLSEVQESLQATSPRLGMAFRSGDDEW